MAPQKRDEFTAFDESAEGGDIFDGVKKGGDRENTEETVKKADYEAAIRERNEAQRLRDEAIRGMLEGAANAPRQPEPQPQPGNGTDQNYQLEGVPENVDPETRALLSSVLAAERRRTEELMNRRFGPAIEQMERDRSIEEIENAVPGFKQELMNEVEQMFRELPPDVQKQYDNKVGIEALAARAKLRKLEEGIQAAAPDMAFNAPARRTKQATTKKGVEATDIWSLSDDDFDTLISRVRTGL